MEITRGQRVQVLIGRAWLPATVLGWSPIKVEVRTDDLRRTAVERERIKPL